MPSFYRMFYFILNFRFKQDVLLNYMMADSGSTNHQRSHAALYGPWGFPLSSCVFREI